MRLGVRLKNGREQFIVPPDKTTKGDILMTCQVWITRGAMNSREGLKCTPDWDSGESEVSWSKKGAHT